MKPPHFRLLRGVRHADGERAGTDAVRDGERDAARGGASDEAADRHDAYRTGRVVRIDRALVHAVDENHLAGVLLKAHETAHGRGGVR